MFSFPTLQGWTKTEHGQDKKRKPWPSCQSHDLRLNFLRIANFLALSIQAAL